MRHPTPSASSLLIGAILLASCATSNASVEVTSEATSSPYFSLGRPNVYKTQGGLELAGRVCRRARTTLLSPPRVRLEHIAATGAVADSAHAAVPAIYRRSDQACANYSARVAWTMADGDTVRACFDRGRPCPAAAGNKAVVPVPASPAPALPSSTSRP